MFWAGHAGAIVVDSPDAPAAAAAAPPAAKASDQPIALDTSMPVDNEDAWKAWMNQHLPPEGDKWLDEKWERSRALLHNKDVTRDLELRAFLATPRERFVAIKSTVIHAYESNFLDIGYGVTISGPHLVMHMTTALDVKPTDKVLEIGTGSGYQSGIISALTTHSYTIEIIQPLGERTRANYDKLIADGWSAYKNVHTKIADGYYGWEENAPFDKIIVTCGIDHIPPPLLKQLAVGGTMVIPVGPPGHQTVLAVHKTQDASGQISITRTDIYGGKIVPFVPFTKEGGGTWNGK
jgi:protein-L-isoaspartate(D-aspartate) O-methyltransferase